ncbi:MAG: M61 family peptidase [Bacteroidota bacterium]
MKIFLLACACGIALSASAYVPQPPSETHPENINRLAPLDWVLNHPGTIKYQLDLTDIDRHELHITVNFPAVPTGIFTIRMPTASPGRYAEHNFAKNVYDLTATDAQGQDLLVDRSNINEWTIAGHRGRVIVRYTLYANGPDGTYAGIDLRKLHLNMPATFIYGVELPNRPVLLELPTNQQPQWQVATQLVHLGSRRFAAPNYAYFFDSPTLVGDMDFRRYLVNSGPKVDTIELAIMHEGTAQEVDQYFDWIKRIVNEQVRVYGELPDFDYGRYTFLCSYNPYVRGDGMEHRNSTICTDPLSLAEDAEELIYTVSHEFFHAWNVERLRPAHLEPFDFDHANMCDELWFAEGFTSYYDDLTLVRTGIIDLETYCQGIERLINRVFHAPGRRHRNPIEMSRMAPFVDAGRSNDPVNYANTFVSYYPYGAMLGLCLDLELRRRGYNLDQLMRLCWQNYGRSEIPYHIRDIEMMLAQLSRDPAWAAEWLNKHVYSSELPDMSILLRQFGLRLRQAEPGAASFYELYFRENEEGLFVDAPVLENSTLYSTGIGRGDRIISLNGKPINNEDDWNAAVAELSLNQTYLIEYEKMGIARQGQFFAQASPAFKLTPLVTATPNEASMRTAWLGQ